MDPSIEDGHEIPGPLDHKRYRDPGRTEIERLATRSADGAHLAKVGIKQRIMNRMHRRKENWTDRHATPAARTGRPTHVSIWRTTSDQRLVLDAIRLGVVRTGLGRQPWGPDGQFRTRKALFVAVERAKQAGTEPTEEDVATAEAIEAHWKAAGNG